MKTVRDLFLTVIVLSALIGGLIAVPFLIVFLIIIGVGFCIYAIIHDARIARELEEENIETKSD